MESMNVAVSSSRNDEVSPFHKLLVQWKDGFIFFLFFPFYVFHAAPSLTPGDAGEFMAGGIMLGLPHAPSYPLYVLLSHAFTFLLHVGAMALRFNYFSAFCGAMAVTFLYGLFRELETSSLVAFLAACLFGFSRSFFENSLVTEVFALHMALSIAVVWLLIRSHMEGDNDRRFYQAAFLVGVAACNQQTVILLLPFFVERWLSMKKKAAVFAVSLLLVAAGFSLNLFLPLRAKASPALNWGNPTTMKGLLRTLSRADYGSTKMSTADAPPRTLATLRLQLTRYHQNLASEIPWPILAAGGFGLLWGLFRKKKGRWGFLLFYLLSGPVFYVFANLPLTELSDGLMGRFLLYPVMALTAGLVYLFGKGGLVRVGVLLTGACLTLQASYPDLRFLRTDRLVHDYGLAMLETLPKNSLLFLDGGDEAFYSLMYFHHALMTRPDVSIYDRGGLVFKSPYGDDFRRLSKQDKDNRRRVVEGAYVGVRPLFYGTMDPNVLPGVSLRISGFLYEAEPTRSFISWPLLMIRSLYPLAGPHYRHKALAAFFPYMQGRLAREKGDDERMMRYFRRALAYSHNIDWLNTNIEVDYALSAYEAMMKERYRLAEQLYLEWLRVNPMAEQANANLGVVYEKENLQDKAEAQYKKTAALFPRMTQPVYNLAVMAWKKSDWVSARRYFNEVLSRDPGNVEARRYLYDLGERGKRP